MADSGERPLEQFILGIPHRFLKTGLYAWLGGIFFWGWLPVASGILLAVVLLCLGLMVWQEQAWEASITRQFHSGGASPYIDRPHAPRVSQIINLVILCASCGFLGWFLKGRFNLNILQWFLFFAGFTLLSRGTRMFGAPVTYIITDQGIGIRSLPGQLDRRLFFKFNEIWQAVRMKAPQNIPLRWQVLAPQRRLKEGLLLHTIRREGLSQQVRCELLLAPTDMERFLQELAGHVPLTQAALTT
jgi:hypothetical protein